MAARCKFLVHLWSTYLCISAKPRRVRTTSRRWSPAQTHSPGRKMRPSKADRVIMLASRVPGREGEGVFAGRFGHRVLGERTKERTTPNGGQLIRSAPGRSVTLHTCSVQAIESPPARAATNPFLRIPSMPVSSEKAKETRRASQAGAHCTRRGSIFASRRERPTPGPEQDCEACTGPQQGKGREPASFVLSAMPPRLPKR